MKGELPEKVDIGLTAQLVDCIDAHTLQCEYEIEASDLRARAHLDFERKVIDELGDDFGCFAYSMIAETCRTDLLVAINRIHFEVGKCYRNVETGTKMRVVGVGMSTAARKHCLIAEVLREDGAVCRLEYINASAISWVEMSVSEWVEAWSAGNGEVKVTEEEIDD